METSSLQLLALSFKSALNSQGLSLVSWVPRCFTSRRSALCSLQDSLAGLALNMWISLSQFYYLLLVLCLGHLVSFLRVNWWDIELYTNFEHTGPKWVCVWWWHSSCHHARATRKPSGMASFVLLFSFSFIPTHSPGSRPWESLLVLFENFMMVNLGVDPSHCVLSTQQNSHSETHTFQN